MEISTALQLLLVLTADWETIDGYLYRWERSSCTAPFVPIGSPIPIVVGEKGMGWGIGLHTPSQKGPFKREGDRKAPAGIFSLGPIFIDPKFPLPLFFKMPLLYTHAEMEAIDDPASLYYNQIVNCQEVKMKDWSSSESMQEELYHLGLVIHHNPLPAIAGKGSCIFMHVWRKSDKGTYGCTAMSQENLKEVLSWLDEDKSPLLIQLPIEEYEKAPFLSELQRSADF